jgi:curved DNA-binding protein
MAEERFKAIAEAYAVLSDPKKRERYDELGPDDFGNTFSDKDIFQGFDPSDLFREFGLPSEQETLDKLLHTDELDVHDPARLMDFFAGFGQKPGARVRTKAPDLLVPLYISFKDAIFGCQRPCAFNAGKGVIKIDVTIPPGTNSGEEILLPGKVPGNYQQSLGDLRVTINILPDDRFTRQGQDLLTDLTLDSHELKNGCEPILTTLEGKSLKLKIPPLTLPGTKLKATGFGVPGKLSRGDLIVKLLLKIER